MNKKYKNCLHIPDVLYLDGVVILSSLAKITQHISTVLQEERWDVAVTSMLYTNTRAL